MSGFKKVLLLMALGISVGVSANSHADQINFIKAKVYLYQWFYLTDNPLSPQEIREDARLVMLLNDEGETDALEKLMKIHEMVPWDPTDRHLPLAMVIDFVDQYGSIHSYYADGCYLYTKDFLRRIRIDSDFRNRFEFEDMSKVLKLFHLRKNESPCQKGQKS